MSCHCGHTPHQHDDTGCKVVILTGWSEREQGFTGERPCGCAEYLEKRPPTVATLPDNGCPHEVARDLSPHCVYCDRIIAENVV